MQTKHLVDPEILPMLDTFPRLHFTPDTLAEIRAVLAETFEQTKTPLPDNDTITMTEHYVPGPHGAPDVRVLLYRPTNIPTPMPVLLWIHGGGYVLGSADQDEMQVRMVAEEVGCAVASVEYRLSPETPFPGPVEDCYAALIWLHGHAAELGVDAAHIAIGGASAGGGLAAGLGLLTRDRGKVSLAFQLLIYPMLDDRTVVSTDPNPYTGEFIWTAESNRFGWTALLGQEPGSAGVSPYAAAARAESLVGLPPTFLSVGALDLFLEEDMTYAQRLMQAGVPTELHVYPGAYHGFNLWAEARVSRAFTSDYLSALRCAFAPAG